jgi:hypothetical protein
VRPKIPPPVKIPVVGTAKVFTAAQITDYFKGVLLQAVNSNIGKAMVKQNVSVLQISAYLDDISGFCKEKIALDFQQFGLELINFYFQSINIPEEDPSFIKLKQIKEKSAELNVVGRDIYQLDKSMDVLKTAAANEGAGSAIMQSGMGIGMGMLVGTQIGQQAGQMLTQMPVAGSAALPPIPGAQPLAFFVAVNGQQAGPFPLAVLQQMATAGSFAPASLVWRQGMAGWQAASVVPELGGLFATATPPPIPPAS